jgi:hypothetical protein
MKKKKRRPQKKGLSQLGKEIKNNEAEAIGKMLKIMETIVENDPTKDILKFIKEDREVTANRTGAVEAVSNTMSTTSFTARATANICAPESVLPRFTTTMLGANTTIFSRNHP